MVPWQGGRESCTGGYVNQQAVHPAIVWSLISDEAGRGGFKSFTGAFVGMACHDVSGRRQPADFEFFDDVERGQ
jgi:beta-xylosidase